MRSLAVLRRRAATAAVDHAFLGLARAGALFPAANPEWHGVVRERNIPYAGSGLEAHTLDVYRPKSRAGSPLPVVLYVHGGAFRFLSKDTHWLMGLAFARRGFVVFNINYRLAPKHCFPAALEDAAAALAWVHDHAAEWGGDPERIVFAGESAGANLVTSLAIATSYERHEPYAAELFERGVRPRAVLPFCGIHQVSDPHRFLRRKKLPGIIADQILMCSELYLPPPGTVCHHGTELADPLLILERGLPPHRPLPPFFACAGTKDPVMDDTRRLRAALERLGVPCTANLYPGEIHAFHAMIWRSNARRCWQDAFEFLHQHVDGVDRTATPILRRRAA